MNKNTKRKMRETEKSRRGMVVSESLSRNMRQVIRQNTGVGGGSHTFHEVINENRPFQPRGKVSQEDNLGKEKQFQVKETNEAKPNLTQ